MMDGRGVDGGWRTIRRRMRLKLLQTIILAGLLLLAVLWSRRQEPVIPQPRPNAPPVVPEFSAPGGVYTNRVVVRLSAASGVIHYTTDGSEPTTSSPKYSNPIEITGSALLQAKVIDPDSPGNATVAQEYFVIEPELAGFSSDLPLVILSTLGRNIAQKEKVPVSARIIEPGESRSTLAGRAGFTGHGELNVRGRSSLRYPKHSYHFQTEDDARRSSKAALLGLPKESDWVLYAPYPDKTLMRDVLGYELSNQMGRYAARTRYVEVFLNEGGGPLSRRDYQGVYVFEEKIKRSKHRVDIQKLRPEDAAEPAITGGYIVKKDHTDQGEMAGGFWPSLLGRSDAVKLPGFMSTRGSFFFYVEPKADTITTPQRSWLRQYINRVEEVVYGNHFADPKTGYAAYLDTGSFIDHHLLVELSKNIDGFRFSTFFYKDRGGKLTMGPIWDWNLTFGNANARDGWIPEGWYWPQLDNQQYTWFRRLFEDPDFTQHYVDRWGELRTNQFAVTNLHARVDYWARVLDESQARNFRRWPILGREVSPNTYVGQTFEDEVDWMKQWIAKRVEWMDGQFLRAPSMGLRVGKASGTLLELRASSGKIYYTVDGTDPRLRGGAVSPRARLYDSPVVLPERGVVFCRAAEDDRWSYPAAGRFGGQQPESGRSGGGG